MDRQGTSSLPTGGGTDDSDDEYRVDRGTERLPAGDVEFSNPRLDGDAYMDQPTLRTRITMRRRRTRRRRAKIDGPDKVNEYYKECMSDYDDKEYCARVAWNIYCSHVNPDYEGCTEYGKSWGEPYSKPVGDSPVKSSSCRGGCGCGGSCGCGGDCGCGGSCGGGRLSSRRTAASLPELRHRAEEIADLAKLAAYHMSPQSFDDPFRALLEEFVDEVLEYFEWVTRDRFLSDTARGDLSVNRPFVDDWCEEVDHVAKELRRPTWDFDEMLDLLDAGGRTKAVRFLEDFADGIDDLQRMCREWKKSARRIRARRRLRRRARRRRTARYVNPSEIRRGDRFRTKGTEKVYEALSDPADYPYGMTGNEKQIKVRYENWQGEVVEDEMSFMDVDNIEIL